MLFHYYDIESLHNVFMLADLMPEKNRLDIFYLIDSPELIGVGTAEEITPIVAERVHLRNLSFSGDVYLRDIVICQRVVHDDAIIDGHWLRGVGGAADGGLLAVLEDAGFDGGCCSG